MNERMNEAYKRRHFCMLLFQSAIEFDIERIQYSYTQKIINKNKLVWVFTVYYDDQLNGMSSVRE